MLRYVMDDVSDIGGGGNEFLRNRCGGDGAAGYGSERWWWESSYGRLVYFQPFVPYKNIGTRYIILFSWIIS
jgi:hypothetical protein